MVKFPKTIQEKLLLWLLTNRREREGRFLVRGVQLERIDPKHPLSGLRRLRALRKDGYVNYNVHDRNRSIYEILDTTHELEAAYRRLVEHRGGKRANAKQNNNDSNTLGSGTRGVGVW